MDYERRVSFDAGPMNGVTGGFTDAAWRHFVELAEPMVMGYERGDRARHRSTYRLVKITADFELVEDVTVLAAPDTERAE